jgi:hypothetical protein
MFAAILGSLVMGTLASKVGENIVGKRLGMSEKDRKLLGTVFGMAGGAYGGYAGQAGFGSSGIGASGSAGGMGGQSPKVGGDYGTAMNLYSQPTVPGAGPGYYGSAPVGNVTNTGYQYIPAMGTEYAPIDNSFNPYLGPNVGNADAPADIGYFANPVKPNPYLGPNVGNADAPAQLFQTNASMDPAALIDMQGGMGGNPVYQGPVSLDTSAQTFALDSPSRTIDLAPSGTPLEVIDASAYTPPSEPFYGVDPNSPTASGSNLGMESVYNSGGNPDIELVPSAGDGYLISPDDQVRLIEVGPDGTVTELPANTDFTNSKQVREAINIDAQLAAERDGVVLHDRRAAAERFEPYMDVYNPATDQERFIRSGPRLEDLDVATLNTPTARLESLDNKVFANDTATTYSPTQSQVSQASQVSLDDPQGTIEGLKAETKAVADVKAQILQDAGDGKFNLGDVLDKIPKAVKEWATMTGVSLLDMWIKQSLFGQDYDDQIASGGGGGGGVLRGSSPVVSPYSGGGSGGGGKGVLFSMGGSGQQGRGTHIMALQ